MEAARYYAQTGGLALGERMFDAAWDALKSVDRMPAIGSPRLGLLCEVPGLRSWRVQGFSVLWLYFEAEAYLDVVRLLGERQDIAALLTAKD